MVTILIKGVLKTRKKNTYVSRKLDFKNRQFKEYIQLDKHIPLH